MERSSPPPAAGVRLLWADVPGRVRRAFEARLGERITEATSSPGGFSPGVAARLRTSGGRRIFVKAAGSEPNPDTPVLHRREAEIVGALPPGVPVPRLLLSHDEGEGAGSSWPSRTWTDGIRWSPGARSSWAGRSAP